MAKAIEVPPKSKTARATNLSKPIIFAVTLEDVTRLFYYGNRADHMEIIREINQIRRLQREVRITGPVGRRRFDEPLFRS